MNLLTVIEILTRTLLVGLTSGTRLSVSSRDADW